MFIDLSNDVKISLRYAPYPVICIGLDGLKCGHVSIVDNIVVIDDAYGPTRDTVRHIAMLVDAIGQEYALRAEKPVSSVMALDPKILVDPSFALKSGNELLQNVVGPHALKTFKRCISFAHIASLS
jgi:hypothetical protein